MGMYTKRILDLIGERPGIRLAEIADAIDCDAQMVEVSIKDELASGVVKSEMIPVPNARPTWAYRLRDAEMTASPAPLRPVEEAPRAPAPAAKEAPKRTKVELAMDFIRSRPSQQATDAELREVMGLTDGQMPAMHLARQRLKFEVHKDGRYWKLGPRLIVKESERAVITEVLKSDFRCAVWSDGELHLARGEQTVMKLSPAEVEKLAAYLASARAAA